MGNGARCAPYDRFIHNYDRNCAMSTPDLKTFFNPSSVAFVGATEDLTKFGGRGRLPVCVVRMRDIALYYGSNEKSRKRRRGPSFAF